MVRILCVRNGGLPGGGSRDPHEDVMQSRLHKREAGDARIGYQGLKHTLRVGAPREPQFLHLAEVADLIDTRKLDASQTAMYGDLDRVFTILVLNRGESAIEDFPAAEDHADVVAHGLGGVHVMCAENDGDAVPPEVEDGGADGFGAYRVEAAERLVKNEQPGLRNHSRDELNFLAQAFAQGHHLGGRAAGKAEAVEPARDFGFSTPPGAKLAVEFEQSLYGHLLVKAAFLGQVADRIGAGLRGAIAEEPDFTA